MQKILLSFMVVLMFVLSGCGQETPMQKLQSNERYDDMNNVFWGKEQGGNTTLWNTAVNYCKGNPEKPNCAPVMEIYVISNGSTKVPAYGTSGNTLTAPDFK